MNERFARAGAIAHVELGQEPEFALGSIRVRPPHCELIGAGWSETLEPRVMQVLVALARANGEVVSRDDLIEACWESHIVSEDSIGRCIGRLRKAAEASGNAFVIETVSRVGYRLKTAELAAPDPAVPANRSSSPATGSTESWAAARRWVVAAGAVVVLGLLAAAFWWRSIREQPSQIPVVPPIPATSVAVLPFANMSGDPAKEYFSDGFSEELLNDLSNDPRLRVVARTSSFAFKGRNGDTQAIGRALRVHAIVEGSVREAGSRARITAQLIDVESGYSIWSASYDRNLADMISVQNEVARAVAVALTHKIIPDRPAAPRLETIDPAVYRLFLEGRQQLDLVSPDGYAKAYRLLKDVTIREPRFADGLAAFSRAAWGYSDIDSLHAEPIAAEAKDAAAKALLLDPRNIEAREMRGLFELDEWNWRGASSDFDILRGQNPNHMRVLAGLRLYYDNMGFPDEAIETMRRAEALDPLSDTPKSLMLQHLRETGRNGEMISVSREILAHRPDDDFALYTLCLGYAWSGQTGKARDVVGRFHRLKRESDAQDCDYAIDVNSGDIPAARKIVEAVIARFPDNAEASDIAWSYVQMNEFDQASDWYERAYEHHENIFSVAYSIDLARNGARYRKTARWMALTQKPLFRAWQVEHDRIAAELAARHGAP